MYEYRCKVLKVVDGDTVDVDIDLGFGIVLKKEGIRDQVIESLLNEEIETRPFFWPLHLQNINQLPSKINPNLKNSEFIGNNGLYIPTGAHLNKKIQTFIAETLINKVRSYI